MSIAFVIPGEPVGKGRARAVRTKTGIRMHTPEKTENYEAKVALFARQAMGGAEPFDGPVAVNMVVCHAVPASASKRSREAMLSGQKLPVKRPDLDNVVKALDALNGIVWIDDAQIVDLHARRQWAESGYVFVRVRPVKPGATCADSNYPHSWNQ
jgi:Holliday junction resolvase RusA-like endonuclease